MICDSCEVSISPVSAVRVGMFRYCEDCTPDDAFDEPWEGDATDSEETS